MNVGHLQYPIQRLERFNGFRRYFVICFRNGKRIAAFLIPVELQGGNIYLLIVQGIGDFSQMPGLVDILNDQSGFLTGKIDGDAIDFIDHDAPAAQERGLHIHFIPLCISYSNKGGIGVGVP